MSPLLQLHRLNGNLVTLIIAATLLRSERPLSQKEIGAPTDRGAVRAHLRLLMHLGWIECVGRDNGPVAGSGRRPMLYTATEAGRQQIPQLLNQ